MKINFKAADHTDINEIVEMMEIFYQHEQLEFNPEKIRIILQDLLTNFNLGRVWLIRSGEENIGYLILTYSFSVEYGGRDALIDELYIKQNFRNKGIGTEALKFIENGCRTIGINAVHLQVKKFNSDAKRLYERIGYKVNQRDYLTKRLN